MQQQADPVVTTPPVAALAPVQPSADEAQFAHVATQIFAKEGNDATQTDMSSLSQVLLREWAQAKQDRMETELRWLKDLRQYRGLYEPDVEADLKDRSKAFMRKTRVKVKTMDSRVGDLTFPAGGEKNWSIDATPDPQVDDTQRQQIAQQLQQQNNGQQPTEEQLDAQILALATESAKGMSKTCEDQLAETKYVTVSKHVQHSAHLYGTGILKGPLVQRRVRSRYENVGGKWQIKPTEYLAPFLEQTSIWRWYPDMSADELESCRYVYELHRMTHADMFELAQRPSFDGEKIKAYLAALPYGQVDILHFEAEIKKLGDRITKQGDTQSGQFDVIERWGWLTGRQIQEANPKLEVPADRLDEPFFANIWFLPNGDVIRAVLQPIDGVTWPYHLYYYDKDETSIFGEGIPSIMRDDQDMLNAAVRMMLDNGAMTTGPIIEVFYNLLSGFDKKKGIGPWTMLMRNGQKPEQPAVRAIEIPNHIEWLSKMAEFFDNSSDENSGIPKYQTGGDDGQGAQGTARGLSMLMGAANVVTKDQVCGWDDVVQSFINALYHWNMKFHRDPKIKGDFDVMIRATASLIAKEVRAQAISQFAAQTNNPADQQFIKRDVMLRSLAECLELSNIVKTEDEVKADAASPQAQEMQAMQQRLAAAQLALAEGQASKITNDAKLILARVQEVVVNVDQIIAKTIQTKVDTIFAALQAGGVATKDPVIAPAGDTILQDAGYKGAIESPTISQLDGPPVQPQQSTVRVMDKGQAFEQDPRVDGGQAAAAAPAPQQGAQQPGDPAAGVGSSTLHPQPAAHATQPEQASVPPVPSAQTGETHGIETTRIE